jgi:hypothetical protein
VTSVRQELVKTIWRGVDPFFGFPRRLYQRDLQGWGAEHRFLSSTIVERRPSIIVEVGTWKGASTLFMADLLRVNNIDGVVISVDTWLGSAEHWRQDRWFGELNMEFGYPSLQRKFMNNVLESSLEDYVLPLPLDSLNAASIMKSFNITPDLIHLDGGHDYESVSADLRVWWERLSPGGFIVGDDYHDTWPGVKRAFDEAFGASGALEIDIPKCRVEKRFSL